MSQTRAVMLSVATFVTTLVLCAVLFLALDIDALYIIGAAIAAAAGAAGVYASARRDAPPDRPSA